MTAVGGHRDREREALRDLDMQVITELIRQAIEQSRDQMQRLRDVVMTTEPGA